jgi:hypothetical protein
MKTTTFVLQLLMTGIFFTMINLNLFAQPSGGPYGPVQNYYELPDVPGTIYYVSPDGNAGVSGLAPEEPTSIESAVEKAVSGDAIVLRGGTYRTGNLTFNQAIVMQPYRDEHPVLKGTRVAGDWQQAGEGVWVTRWKPLFPGKPENWWNREHNERFTPMHRFNNDGIFIDGEFLQSVGSKEELDEATFFVDYEDEKIYIGVDPADKFIEITAFRKALVRPNAEVRGKKPAKYGPVIRGLEITQYPDTMVHIGDDFWVMEQDASDLTGTVFENCTFSNCFRIALFAISDSMVIRNCEVRNTNTEGLYIVASKDVLLEKNIIANNNIERWTGFFPAAVKIFNQTLRAKCNDNLVTDHPYSNGIWYDVGNKDGIFVNNWVQNVGMKNHSFNPNSIWPGQNGFFFEISKGAVCAGNVFVNCDHSIMVLNSSNAKIYQNTFINSQVCIARDQRSSDGDLFDWHILTGPGVEERTGHEFVNNLLYGDAGFNEPLLFVWQPESMCERLKKPALHRLDNNVYVNEKVFEPVILMNQQIEDKCTIAANTPSELNSSFPDYATHSVSLKNYHGPLFKSIHLGNYQLLKNFPGLKVATDLPESVKKLMGEKKFVNRPGAFKPCPE